MSDSEIEKVEGSLQDETKMEDDTVDNTAESSENKTDDEWELLDPDDNAESEMKTEDKEKSSIDVVDSDKSEEQQSKEVIEDVDSLSDQNLGNKVQSEPAEDDTGKELDEPAKEPDADTEPAVVKDDDDIKTDVTSKPFADQEPAEDVEKSEETEPVQEPTLDVEEADKDTDQNKDDLEDEEKPEESVKIVEMAPTEDAALPSLGEVHLLQSELLMERVKLRKRMGGAAGRRPPTKRASWTDGQGRPVSWMFADSAEPKLVDLELPSDDEDEKEAEDRIKRDEEVHKPPKSRVPIGGVPSPMMLPGLADAVKFRKKTPARRPREIGNTKSNENTEVKSPPWAKNILKSPGNDGGLKISGLSPSWASGSAFKQPKPAKDIPEKRPKPVVRPRPKPRPKSIAVMSDLQGQPVVLSQELLQKVERQSLKQKAAEKNVTMNETENKTQNKTEKKEENKTESKEGSKTENKSENKLANKQSNKPTVSILIKTPSVEEKPESPSPVLEKKLNSDIINAQKKMEDKMEKEDVSKTPQWIDQKKKLPPIPKNKPKPAPRPVKPDKSSGSQPQWKQDLVKKKKEDEAQGKKKPVIGPQRKANPNAPVITTLPDWQQDLAEKVQKKKKQDKSEKGDEEKNEKEKMPEWKRQAAERAQRRKKMENAHPPSNRPSHVDETPHPDETPNWKKQLEEKTTAPPLDKEVIVIKTVDSQSDCDNVENNKEQSGNIPQWKKELMERKQRSRSVGDLDQANKKIHISEIIPKDGSSSVPSWKTELEKRKQARLEKTYKSVDQVEETF